jgi:5-methylcytosine-specific restriction endonuclease McrA
MNPLYPVVAARAGHRCEYCRAPEGIFNLRFEVEHIFPTSREGLDEVSNCALACRSCNLHKSNQVEGLDELTDEIVRLFHPRNHRWEEHFRVDMESGTIVGLTEIGRVTIVSLQLNRPNQLTARRQWMRLALYP